MQLKGVISSGRICRNYCKNLRVFGSRRRRTFLTSSFLAAAQAAKADRDEHLERVRNIGIIAHIDAGKTTTTERMLYYSGFTRRIGNVDEGSTVTDFLPAERARGITIQSAAITFHWPPASSDSIQLAPNSLRNHQHTVNLIDTPGHADFTFEVIRSLRVLDGAICILDGVAGVEAQTEKVWHQASSYSIPRVIYVNKLDREGAAFNRTVKEIATRLNTWPALCEIPWWRDGQFVGVGDTINLCGMLWQQGGDGSQFQIFTLEDLRATEPNFATELSNARTALIETLTEQDSEMVEAFLEAEEDCLQISDSKIWTSLRRCLLSKSQAITPVFAGASFRNIGIQPLLDAVNMLLPSPTEALDPEIGLGQSRKSTLRQLLKGNLDLSLTDHATSRKSVSISSTSSTPPARSLAQIQNLNACALAFKVVNDARRGVLVYVRVYSGMITRNSLLFNANLTLSERANRLLRMYASEAVEIESINEGQIGVITGLKHARTGDTLIVYAGAGVKSGPPSPINSLQLRPIHVPPPVFFTSVEPNSLAEEKNLKEKMELLLREDPSLKVTLDPESGQTHLAGMGELHLEIARDRLINDFKVKATTGKIEITYRETITEASDECTERFDREVAGKQAAASCQTSVHPSTVLPADDTEIVQRQSGYTHRRSLGDSNTLLLYTPSLDLHGNTISSGSDHSGQTSSLPPHLPIEEVIAAFQVGAFAALARGPHFNLPMHSTGILITFDPSQHLTPTTNSTALSSTARLAIQLALRDSANKQNTKMMEPVMLVSITVPESAMGAVVHDLSSARGGQVLSLDTEEEDDDSAAVASMDRLSDAQLERIYAPPDPFGSDDSDTLGAATAQRQIKARVPLKEMVGYLKHLRSLTAGRATFTMAVDRYETMSSQRVKSALSEIRGELAV